MGAGHVKFFYNKGLYLAHRTKELYQECRARGFNVQEKTYKLHEGDLNEDWEPREVDILTNEERILERIREKPDFYTMRPKVF
jgi:hypothetical protein